MEAKRAVVLLSGGLDSTTVLAFALHEGFECMTLNIDYGQRHSIEVQAAMNVYDYLAQRYPDQLTGFETMRIPDFGNIAKSALTGDEVAIPHDRPEDEMGDDIPVTYVPMRNTVFVAMAFALAESHGMSTVFHGANVLDYSGYPDCRPEYFSALQRAITLGSTLADQKRAARIFTPVIHHSKTQIIELALRMGAPLAMTHSCYSPHENGKPCGKCDSCILRVAGFKAAGIPDPAMESWATGTFMPLEFLPKPPQDQ